MILFGLVIVAGACLTLALLINEVLLFYVTFIPVALGLSLLLLPALRSKMPANDEGSGVAESRALYDENESGKHVESHYDVVYVSPGRKRFHRHDCRLLSGVAREEVTPVEADEEGFTPCTLCAPMGQTQDTTASRAGS